VQDQPQGARRDRRLSDRSEEGATNSEPSVRRQDEQVSDLPEAVSRNEAGTSIVIAKPTNRPLSSATNTRRRLVLRFSSSQHADREASEASP
jgi:hypothetical protein